MIDEVRAYVDAAGTMGKIVSIAVDGTAEVEVYIRNQARMAARVGLDFDQQMWSRDITQDACKSRIQDMNDDPSVLGIIIQRPLPSHINIRSLQSAVHPLKDLEGMNPASIGNIIYSDIALVPCTAAASVELIKATGLTLPGLEVVMIGHSEIVGRPAAMMLMAEGATVTICHHMTRSVAMHSRRADVVLVAVGSPHLIRADMIKPGAVVIDIGINQITTDDGTSRIVGDVDTAAVAEVAGWITPVPGGVGPVTVAVLMRNAKTAHMRQKQIGWRA
jgi:methylenetetrahydrofolate dehydrogenase (NADP+)/methenyltetrahydrofolate cyclohydrolase